MNWMSKMNQNTFSWKEGYLCSKYIDFFFLNIDALLFFIFFLYFWTCVCPKIFSSRHSKASFQFNTSSLENVILHCPTSYLLCFFTPSHTASHLQLHNNRGGRIQGEFSRANIYFYFSLFVLCNFCSIIFWVALSCIPSLVLQKLK